MNPSVSNPFPDHRSTKRSIDWLVTERHGATLSLVTTHRFPDEETAWAFVNTYDKEADRAVTA